MKACDFHLKDAGPSQSHVLAAPPAPATAAAAPAGQPGRSSPLGRRPRGRPSAHAARCAAAHSRRRS